MNKSVGIWLRVSTEDQAKGESPETHLKRARGYAELKGWNVREVYRLDGVSGKAVMHATETQRMLDDVRRGHITALIFSKLARLARNTKELLDFSDHFRAHDADLISLKESIDTSTPAVVYQIITRAISRRTSPWFSGAPFAGYGWPRKGGCGDGSAEKPFLAGWSFPKHPGCNRTSPVPFPEEQVLDFR